MNHRHDKPLTGRGCNSNDLILVSEGVQCSNCLALVESRRPRTFGPAAFLAPRGNHGRGQPPAVLAAYDRANRAAAALVDQNKRRNL